MELAAKMDSYGWPAWVAAMVLGFIFFWPAGLAVLAYLLWSGRMGCSKTGPGRWHGERGISANARRMWRGRGGSSGNRAFDEYKEETLARLEEEQKDFFDFLDRLRHARDKEEFDRFMAERSTRKDDGEQASAKGPAPQAQS